MIINDKNNLGGSLYTRNLRNIIEPAIDSLNSIYENIINVIDTPTIASDLTGNNILNMDIWYDIMMIYTPNYLVFTKLDFDYATGILSNQPGNVNYIPLIHTQFAGTWFFENTKKVTVCTLVSCSNQIRPVLRQLDLNTNKLSFIYNNSSVDTDMSSFSLTSIQNPVFTYSDKFNIYNISYTGYNSIKSGMYLISVNINNYDQYCTIKSANITEPTN